MKSFAVAIALTGTLLMDSSWAETPLLLERKIPLGEVRGRIDHLTVDLKPNHLFVAELENDTVAVVDLDDYQVMQVISGLKKPQGGLAIIPRRTLCTSPTAATERWPYSAAMITRRSRGCRWVKTPTMCVWMQSATK